MLEGQRNRGGKRGVEKAFLLLVVFRFLRVTQFLNTRLLLFVTVKIAFDDSLGKNRGNRRLLLDG